MAKFVHEKELAKEGNRKREVHDAAVALGQVEREQADLGVEKKGKVPSLMQVNCRTFDALRKK